MKTLTVNVITTKTLNIGLPLFEAKRAVSDLIYVKNHYNKIVQTVSPDYVSTAFNLAEKFEVKCILQIDDVEVEDNDLDKVFEMFNESFDYVEKIYNEKQTEI